jgi:signal transduction histidine kinase/endonuclease YncB( thermonuclease family)
MEPTDVPADARPKATDYGYTWLQLLRVRFNRFIHRGSEHARHYYQQPKILLTNRLCIIFLSLFVLYVIPAVIEGDGITVSFAGLSVGLCGFILFLNQRGYFTLARVLLITSGAVILATAIAQYVFPPDEVIEPEARMLQFVNLALPLLLFDLRERMPLWLSLFIVMGAYFLPVPISRWMGNPPLTADYQRHVALNITNMVVATGALFSALFYMQRQFVEAEEKGRRLLNHLQTQNKKLLASQTLLQEQNLDIESSREELFALSEQLTLRNRDLEVSKDELTAAMATLQTKQALEEKHLAMMTVARWRDGDTLTEWADRVLNYLVPQFHGLQGSLYLTGLGSSEGGRHALHMQLLGVFGIGEETPTRIQLGDGLVGQLVQFNEPFRLESSPRLKGTINSGTLRISPDSLYIIPLTQADKPIGLLELTTRVKLSEDEYMLFEALCKDIADGLASLQSQLRIEELLETARETAEALETRERKSLGELYQLEEANRQLRVEQNALQVINEKVAGENKTLNEALERKRKQVGQLKDQLAHAEKMATLGSLAAGIAHEINSPLGAIQTSAGNLLASFPQFVAQAPQIFREIDDVRLPLLLSFLDEVLQPTAGTDAPTARTLRLSYAALLAQHAVPDPEALAGLLTDAGFSGKLEPYAALLHGQEAPKIITLAYWLGQMRTGAATIVTASRQSGKIVAALKNFSYSQGVSARVETDINAHLETVLTLYTAQFKYGIELVMDFDPSLPKIPVYPDELSQVWTNLLQNALHAMGGEGMLKVQTLQQGHTVVISFTDSGPGIPAHLHERVFAPFFTTKNQGEGSGLGLHICRKIVTRHGGQITVSSVPGSTTFQVVLPTHPAYVVPHT